MSEGGYILQKCRLCGEIIRPLGVPSVMLALLSITHGIGLPEAWGVPFQLHMNSQHSCADGRTGVTDVIGGEPYES